MLRGLRAQLSLSFLAVALIAIALISILSNWLISREFEDYITRQESERSESIVSDLGNQYSAQTGGWDETLLHTVGMYSLYDGYLLKIYDGDGTLLWDAENHDMTLCSQIMGEITERMAQADRQGEFITHSYAVTSGGAAVGSVSITYYGPFFFTENDYLFIRTLNLVLLAVGGLSCALALAAGSLLARRIARPITKTADIAGQIARGNYEIRFEGKPGTRELQELTAAINRLTEALSEQEALRKRLTADVAHELRTPLSAVGAHLEAMLEGIWEPTAERLQSCHDEIERLGHLVADLERLSRIEDGQLKLAKEPTDLYDIGRTAVQNLAPAALRKRIAVSMEGGPAPVEADRERMLQVVMNLLSNAINYTPEEGHIRVKAESAGGRSSLSVTDDGIGIPAEELPFIFERFYRTDRSRSRKTGGTGIGLTIAKTLTEAQGGKIEVESAPGVGSCFRIVL